MDTLALPPDFKEFLQLLNSNGVEYLLIGGYAVGYYGYIRATAGIDIWVAMNSLNAEKLVATLQQFGFSVSQQTVELFLKPDSIVRLGVPPFRIEILTSVSGVLFNDCFAMRVMGVVDGVTTHVISLPDLKINKRASGRGKDLTDLEHLA